MSDHIDEVDRHTELRTKALENFVEAAGSYEEAVNTLSHLEKREYNRLEHRLYGECNFCPDGNAKECEFSCICGEKGDPSCGYCISHDLHDGDCPALQ